MVLAHGTEQDPKFIYANQAAQACFAYSWEEFLAFASTHFGELKKSGGGGLAVLSEAVDEAVAASKRPATNGVLG